MTESPDFRPDRSMPLFEKTRLAIQGGNSTRQTRKRTWRSVGKSGCIQCGANRAKQPFDKCITGLFWNAPSMPMPHPDDSLQMTPAR